MSWSSPPAFAANATLTAAQLNVLSGDLNAIAGASSSWGSITTVWTGSGGGTPAIGSGGSFTARYRQDNKWVDVFVQIVLGTGFTAPTGTWQIVLPVAARDTGWGGAYGRALDVTTSTTQGFKVTADVTASSLMSLRCDATTAGNVDRVLTSSQPFTWDVGDTLTIKFRYEAA